MMSEDNAAVLPVFGAEDFRRRRQRLRAQLAVRGVPAVVVTAPEDIFYLTGWSNQGHFAFTALLVTTDAAPVLVAREMEAPTAAAQIPDCDFAGYGDRDEPALVLARTIRRSFSAVAAKVGYQPRSMTFPIAIWQQTRYQLDPTVWIDCSDMVARLRAVHSQREIACIRAAAKLSDQGMQAAVAALTDGVSEAVVAATIQHTITTAGSDYPGFAPLVRPISHADQEHVAWSTRRLEATDSALLEMSAAVARYHAPLTRTVPVTHRAGGDPASEIAWAGQCAIRANVRPGRTCEDVYWAWRSSVDSDLGVANERHHCGYLIGIGFPPSWVGGNHVSGLRPGNQTVLRAGMAIYAQSWVIRQAVGDHVVCDTLLVTDEGCEPLTTTPPAPRDRE